MNDKTKEHILFGVNFLKNPLRNASVIPSSVWARRAMLKNINFRSVHSIVELGPGTGTFTEEIIRRSKPGTKIILIEIEKSYVRLLRKKFGKRVIVENSSAHLLDEVLAKHGLERADLIISGLPFPPEKIKKQIFRSIRRQTDQGTIFRFFTYMPPVIKKVYKTLPIKKLFFVPRNFPPLWVFGIN